MSVHDKRFDLNQMKIASPCAMSWNDMKGDDRSRHCGACKLNVYNIAGLTNQEAQELLLKRAAGERVCVRILRRHDGTVLTKDCPVGVSLARRARLRFASLSASAIAMVLWFASPKTQAQEHDESTTVSEAPVTIMPVMGKIAPPSEYTEMAGGLRAPIDENGEVDHGGGEIMGSVVSPDFQPEMGEIAPEGYDEPTEDPGSDDYQY